MKRMARVLVVAVLVAMILVTSISPAMARRALGGHPMPTTKPCSATTKAQNEGGAHFEERPQSDVALCWLVFPNEDE